MKKISYAAAVKLYAELQEEYNTLQKKLKKLSVSVRGTHIHNMDNNRLLYEITMQSLMNETLSEFTTDPEIRRQFTTITPKVLEKLRETLTLRLREKDLWKELGLLGDYMQTCSKTVKDNYNRKVTKEACIQAGLFDK